MTNLELVAKVREIAEKYKTVYILGCIGSPMTPAMKTQHTVKTNYNFNKQADRVKKINSCTEDTFGFDCVCLIKGVLWGWSGNKSKTYGGAVYKSNNVPDIGADAMIKECSGVSTNFSKIEKGEVVWMKGHIGVYIGDGLCVECTPIWKDGVQITAVKNIGSKKGYNERTWTKHGKLPYITYVAEPKPAPEKKTETKPVAITTTKTIVPTTVSQVKIGEIVEFAGGTHYAGSKSLFGKKVKSCKAKITAIDSKGKHPIHLRAVDSKGKFISGAVYGWVNLNTIKITRTITTTVQATLIERLAKEIIEGKWGTGEARKNNLKKAGYDEATITAAQKKVNEMLK